MNLDELRTVRDKERQTDTLQHLRDSFYEEVDEYVGELIAEHERTSDGARVGDPAVSQLAHEIETARTLVEGIWERRMGKLVKQSSLAAAGLAAADEGLTREEQALFADLVDAIEDNRETVLGSLGTRSATESADRDEPDSGPPDPTPDRSAEPTLDAADALGGTDREASRSDPEPPTQESSPPQPTDPTPPAPDPGTEDSVDEPLSSHEMHDGSTESPPDETATPSSGGTASPDDTERSEPSSTDPVDDRTTVRIVRDVGEIFGIDERAYTLSEEDVIQLPEANADPLIERGAAERLE